jgi:hypothetical protein
VRWVLAYRILRRNLGAPRSPNPAIAWRRLGSSWGNRSLVACITNIRLEQRSRTLESSAEDWSQARNSNTCGGQSNVCCSSQRTHAPVMVGRQPKRTSSLSSPSVDVPGSGVSLVPLAARQSVWGVARAACRAAATPFGVAIVKSGVDSASFPAAGACVENQGHSPPVCVASSTWPVSSRGTVLLPPSIEASLVRRAGSRGGHLMRISRNDT